MKVRRARGSPASLTEDRWDDEGLRMFSATEGQFLLHGDDDAEDLAGSWRGVAEVGDVEGFVGSEGHAGGNRQTDDDVLKFAICVETDDFAGSGCGVTGGGREFQGVEQTIRTEFEVECSGETGANGRQAEAAEITRLRGQAEGWYR